MDTKERSAVTKKNRAARGEEELRLWCMQGTRDIIADLMEWSSDTEQASAITSALMYVPSLGPETVREALKMRHDLKIKESWREAFINESRRELLRNPGDEIISPVMQT
jgi:hypothetical protein